MKVYELIRELAKMPDPNAEVTARLLTRDNRYLKERRPIIQANLGRQTTRAGRDTEEMAVTLVIGPIAKGEQA